MLSMLFVLLIALGVVAIIVSMVATRRNGEAELSKDMFTHPLFIIGIADIIISIIALAIIALR